MHEAIIRGELEDSPRATLSLRLHGYSLILSAVAAASVLRAAVASFMATSSSRQKVSHPTCEIETHTYTLIQFKRFTTMVLSSLLPAPDLTHGTGVGESSPAGVVKQWRNFSSLLVYFNQFYNT